MKEPFGIGKSDAYISATWLTPWPPASGPDAGWRHPDVEHRVATRFGQQHSGCAKPRRVVIRHPTRRSTQNLHDIAESSWKSKRAAHPHRLNRLVPDS